ncbi:GNAT family N-acetyltransferase, partial [Campylobacter jejuni]
YEEKGQIIYFISINIRRKNTRSLLYSCKLCSSRFIKALLEFTLKSYPYSEIYAFASFSVKNFFLKAGFKIIKENIVIIDQ